MKPFPGRQVLSVSELTDAIAALLEQRFPFVHVAGEISNLRRPRSGHIYFTLKDNRSQLRAVLFKMQQRYLQQELKDGTQVLCQGRISVYEPRGEYQLIVDSIDLHGAGALQLAFERLKARLAAEGLFDEHLKKPLPAMPGHVTLVTSPSGAAVHDFIRIAGKRFPLVTIAIFPVSVQGETAAAQMIHALKTIDRQVQTDVIVLCRGGGSIEDLWAFNDENLARAIRGISIPVVSAVGHEIDFTIADFVADLRAPTPSGAAELILPDRATLQSRISNCRTRISRSLLNTLELSRNRLALLEHQLIQISHPVETLLLRVDHLGARLEQGMIQHLAGLRNRLTQAGRRLQRTDPRPAIVLSEKQLRELRIRLNNGINKVLENKRQQLGQQAVKLEAVSPLATLARGYSIVTRKKPPTRVITRAAQVRPGDELKIRLHQGQLECRVEKAGDR